MFWWLLNAGLVIYFFGGAFGLEFWVRVTVCIIIALVPVVKEIIRWANALSEGRNPFFWGGESRET